MYTQGKRFFQTTATREQYKKNALLFGQSHLSNLSMSEYIYINHCFYETGMAGRMPASATPESAPSDVGIMPLAADTAR